MLVCTGRSRPLTNPIEPTEANGYHNGRPEGREVEPLDLIIAQVIESIPAATRLYPDIYAWKITDAVTQILRSSSLPSAEG